MRVAGRAPAGDTLPRFSGTWHLRFNSAEGGSCLALNVSPTGTISADCTTFLTGRPFTVARSVDDQGRVRATTSLGGVVTGTLASSIAGSGTSTGGAVNAPWWMDR